MKAKSTSARVALGFAAAAAALAGFAPAAMAQTYYGPNQAYDARNGYAYDACQRDQTGRATVGALIGGAAGLAIGNNAVPDRYYRRGRVDSNRGATAVAGVIGALIGSQIGKSSAACTPSSSYSSYSSTATYSTAPAYAYAPRDSYYDQYQDRYADARDYPPPAYAEPAPRCTYVESVVRMPDGRNQTRMVQACQDSRGRYQIVQ